MPAYEDRVRDTSSSTGTGNLTLDGTPPTGAQSFNAAHGTNKSFYYAIQGQGSAEWETGVGYLSASTTLVRDRVTASSNSNAAVNFSAGTKDVFCDAVAEQFNIAPTAAYAVRFAPQ